MVTKALKEALRLAEQDPQKGRHAPDGSKSNYAASLELRVFHGLFHRPSVLPPLST